MKRAVGALVAVLLAGCAIAPDRVVVLGAGVEGYVHDSDGHIIAGADIDLTRQDGSPAETTERVRMTDAQGFYHVPLQPGNYVVAAVASGYEGPVRANFTVQDKVFTRVDLALTPRLGG